ncbi:MAG: reverse transcriptase-like protein [Caldilineae bacterium]|nr:reverse transcriptase-like protein [Chloroflexota bacterium]MCB9176375.1 reverse transcriptase-like protein [Caldilineae bacterium]
MSAARYAIVFDGGSKGNPGLGYGSYRLREADGAWAPAVRLEFGDKVTNNEAEYRSLIAAFQRLASDCGDPSAVRVEVFGDSQLVLKQLAGQWKVRAGNLAPLWREARAAAGRFAGVTYTWQPRGRSVDLLGH